MLVGVLAWWVLQARLEAALPWWPGPLELSLQLGLTVAEWCLYCLTTLLLVQAVSARHGHHRVSAQIFLAGTALNSLMPLKPGIPLRLYLYRRLLQIPYPAGAAVLLLEGLVISGVPLLAAPLCLWYLHVPIQTGGLIALGVLVAMGLSVGLVRRRRPRRWRSLSRLRYHLLRPWRQVPARMGLGLVLQPLAMLLYALRLWCILAPFGTPPSLLTLAAIAVVSLSAGRLSLLPMGLGVLELSLGLLLTRAGVAPEAVLAAVALNRLWVSVVPVLAGLAALRSLPAVWRQRASA